MKSELKFLIAAIGAGAAFGAIHDFIDGLISPAFYYLLKGAYAALPACMYALYVGITRGAVMGALLGAALLFARDSGKLPTAPLSAVYRLMWLPVILAVVGSLTAAVVGWLSHPAIITNIASSINPDVLKLSSSAQLKLAVVAAMHQGVYSGGVLGALIACHRLIRIRHTPEVTPG